MTPPRPPPAPRRAALATLAAGLLALAGCASQDGWRADSTLTFERTFDVARGALTDQKLAIGQQDRRRGVIVGTADSGVAITATVEPMPDGANRVTFREQPAGADPALLRRVAESYSARMAQLGVFSGFKGPGGSGGGPVPCASVPAFCN